VSKGELKPLTDLFKPEDVITCECGSTAFFDWCVQVIAKKNYGPSPRSQGWTQSENARVCINCHKPIVVYDGTAYDASMYVSSEQIAALIRLGQARQTAVPVRGMDP
jgi:hypothetical protein